MTNFTYMTNPAKLKGFLDTIQTAGVPDKLTYKSLEGLGFKSKADRMLVGVMKALGFLSSDGAPTERWQKYRNRTNGSKVLAQGIRDHYSELFKTYSDAQNRDTEALRNFFSSHTKVAARTLDLMVRTFRAAAALADFESPLPKATPPVSAKPVPAPQTKAVETSVNATSGHVININIQLTMPATDDPKVYDLFFAAMKKHLLG